MGNRKTPLVTNEYYHIYLRGVEKRDIVMDDTDVNRFLLSLKTFNSVQSVGSIYEHNYKHKKVEAKLKKIGSQKIGSRTSKKIEVEKLIDIIAFNVLSNHYHLLLRQRVDGGISKFMQSLNGGYTKYFNHRHKRVGPLFQGAFGSTHIKDDSELKYTSAYVNLNHVVHQLKFGNRTSKWDIRSSWRQYIDVENLEFPVLCSTNSVLLLYSNTDEYKKDAKKIAKTIAFERQNEKKSEDEIFRRYFANH